MISLVESQFRQTVRDGLAPLGAPLQEKLATLVTYSYPEEVVALSFEVFCQSFASGFPVRVFFIDSTNNEYFTSVNGEAAYPSPIDPGLLEVRSIYTREVEDRTMEADSDLDVYSVAGQELIEWFSDCWNRAGGRQLSLAATITDHDAGQEFNLQTGTWQARYAGFEP